MAADPRNEAHGSASKGSRGHPLLTTLLKNTKKRNDAILQDGDQLSRVEFIMDEGGAHQSASMIALSCGALGEQIVRSRVVTAMLMFLVKSEQARVLLQHLIDNNLHGWAAIAHLMHFRLHWQQGGSVCRDASCVGCGLLAQHRGQGELDPDAGYDDDDEEVLDLSTVDVQPSEAALQTGVQDDDRAPQASGSGADDHAAEQSHSSTTSQHPVSHGIRVLQAALQLHQLTSPPAQMVTSEVSARAGGDGRDDVVHDTLGDAGVSTLDEPAMAAASSTASDIVAAGHTASGQHPAEPGAAGATQKRRGRPRKSQQSQPERSHSPATAGVKTPRALRNVRRQPGHLQDYEIGAAVKKPRRAESPESAADQGAARALVELCATTASAAESDESDDGPIDA